MLGYSYRGVVGGGGTRTGGSRSYGGFVVCYGRRPASGGRGEHGVFSVLHARILCSYKNIIIIRTRHGGLFVFGRRRVLLVTVPCAPAFPPLPGRDTNNTRIIIHVMYYYNNSNNNRYRGWPRYIIVGARSRKTPESRCPGADTDATAVPQTRRRRVTYACIR